MDRETNHLLTGFLRYATVVVITAVAVSLWYGPAPSRTAPSDEGVAAAQAAPPARPRETRDAPPPAVAQPIAPTTENGLSPSLVDEVLDVAEDIDKKLAARLRALCAEDPQHFQRVMSQSGRRLLGLVRLRHRDPALYQAKVQELQLEHRAGHLAAEYCRAVRRGQTDVAQEKRQEIRRLLQIQFGLSMKVRGDSLLRLTEQVKSLEDELTRDANHYEQWVTERLEGLLQRYDSAENCEPDDLS